MSKTGAIICLLLLSVSCKERLAENTFAPGSPNVRFEYSAVTLGGDPGSGSKLSGHASADWSLEIPEDAFFTVTPENGKAGDFEIEVVSKSESPATEDRKSSFVFNADGRRFPVTVTQTKSGIKVKASLPSGEDGVVFEFGKDGTLLSPSEALTVEANADWVSEGNVSWLSSDPASGVPCMGAPVKVIPKAEANPFAEERTAKLMLGVPDYLVYEYNARQKGGAFTCDIKFEEDVPVSGSAIGALDGSGQTVGFVIAANAGWTILPEKTASWMSFEPSSHEATLDPVLVRLSVSGNSSFSEIRSASFSIDFNTGDSSDDKKFTVLQAPGLQPDWARQLYDLFGGLATTLGWSLSESCYSWDGLETDGVDLRAIKLTDRGLEGAFPAGDWEQFTKLNKIEMAGNNLTGTIPSSLARNAAVDVLDLSGNELTGSLDDAFASFGATVFKVSGNKLSGTVCADFADNPKYASWNPMVNIFPQDGDVSDPDDINYNPQKWAFTLTEAGVLRVVYNTMGGAAWTKFKNASWRTSETIKVDASNDGVAQVNADGSIKKLQLDGCGLDGVFPYELAMLKGIYEVDFKNNGNITTLHRAYMQNIKSFNLNQCKITMSLNDIWDMVGPDVVTIRMMNEKGALANDGTGISDRVLEFTKLTVLSIRGNGLTGKVSDAVLDKFKASNPSYKSDLFKGNSFTDEAGNPLTE